MPDDRGMRWYVPTTRNNVVGMLTAGMVMPARGLTKYYEDLLSLAPSRVVLSSLGARRDWFDLGDEARRESPALIEVEVTPSGEALGDGSARVAAPAAIIPASKVRAVHFATEGDATEFVARRYDNFVPDRALVAVSSELFNVDQLPDIAHLGRWLEELPESQHPTAAGIGEADSLGGAILMLIAVPASSPDELRSRAAVLDRLLSAAHGRAMVDIVTDALAVPEWLSADVEADKALLRSAVSVLARLSPAPHLGARRVIADVIREVEGDDELVATNLSRVDSILRAESDLRPMTQTAGLRSAKALLLFLLRPSPEEVVTWADEMGDDPLAVAGAAVLAGMTAGGRRVPATLRRQPIADLVSCLQADRLNSAGGYPLGRFLDPPPILEVRAADRTEGHATCLAVNDVDIVVATGEPEGSSSVQPDLFDTAGSAGNSQPGDSDAVNELGELLDRADFGASDVARAAAAVCKRMEWEDLVETLVDLPDEGFSVRQGRVAFAGVPTITLTVEKAIFLERVLLLPDVSVPEFDALRAATKRRKPGVKRSTKKG